MLKSGCPAREITGLANGFELIFRVSLSQDTMKSNHFDYIVIGSGFGGSVSAMRLAEKGYRVLVVEKGKRWKSQDFPKSNWNLKKYLWLPALHWFGFLRLSFFKEVFILSGVGVGGGSLVYANTHMMPPDAFFNNPVWSGIKDWKNILSPHYETARFMLGSEKYKKENAEDLVLKEIAEEMGRGHTYDRVDHVGVYLGDPKKEIDPYFKGLGPKRKGCIECAGCMVGCRYEAKNTLDKNYLWFAENLFGATVLAETETIRIEVQEDQTYKILTRTSTGFIKNTQTFTANGIVVSGGVLGTLDLLLKQKHVHKTLPNLSDKLGHNLLTNSEMLSGVVAADRKLNHGLAISTVFNPDEHTHIELCKFPDKSGAMIRLATMAAGNGNPIVRTLKMLGNIITHPIDFFRSLFQRNVAKNSVIFLIMQSLPNAMRMKLKRGLFGHSLSFKNDSGEKVPSYIPIGQEVLYKYAAKVNGVPQNAFSEVVFGLASTAHILGGCPMGKTKEEGVVNENFEVHGHKNFYILDGSIVPCNLGVNPSLTITALSEYAMSHIPVKPGTTAKTLSERLDDIKIN
ncbi:MAG: GMC oxidoreductase [Cyclobacteriaceae bacterium]|nr:MAG: GMC oxidoreductase [Cyclobacteriaceae bacterium]